MANESKTAIFFDDLKEDAQVRLINDELEDIVKDPFVVRYLDIDKDTYGYDPDPAKQTLEQHIYASIFVDGPHLQKWFMEWNCLDHEFTTIMREDQKQ